MNDCADYQKEQEYSFTGLMTEYGTTEPTSQEAADQCEPMEMLFRYTPTVSFSLNLVISVENEGDNTDCSQPCQIDLPIH